MQLEPEQLRISPMPKTWILDLDGTLVVHDGPYIMGKDEFLPGAKETDFARRNLLRIIPWEQDLIKLQDKLRWRSYGIQDC